MGDDDEIHLHVTYASHVDMDEAFCACMRQATAKLRNGMFDEGPIALQHAAGAIKFRKLEVKLL